MNLQKNKEFLTKKAKVKISELAFDLCDQPYHSACRFLLKESDKYVPYIAVSNHYKGCKEGTLVLREEPLLNFDYLTICTKEYENGPIDIYMSRFHRNLCRQAYEAHTDCLIDDVMRDKNKKILRDFFILSAEELGMAVVGCKYNQKNKLQYFDNKESRIAYSYGVPVRYFTRTTNDEQKYAISVSNDGTPDKMKIENKFIMVAAIRPAFCLQKETILTRKEFYKPSGTTFQMFTLG